MSPVCKLSYPFRGVRPSECLRNRARKDIMQSWIAVACQVQSLIKSLSHFLLPRRLSLHRSASRHNQMVTTTKPKQHKATPQGQGAFQQFLSRGLAAQLLISRLSAVAVNSLFISRHTSPAVILQWGHALGSHSMAQGIRPLWPPQKNATKKLNYDKIKWQRAFSLH